MKSAHELIAPYTSLAPGAQVSGEFDLRDATDALLSVKITNGNTGPNAGTRIDVYVGHDDGPTAARWNLLQTWTSGVTSGERYEFAYEPPRAAMHLRVAAWGNTGQAVTVEALLSVLEG